MMFITYSLIGIFAVDQKKQIVDYSLFPKDAEKIVKKLEELKSGKIIPELEHLIKKINDKNIVTDIPFTMKNFNIEYKKDLSAGKFLRSNIRGVAIKLKFVKDDVELNKLLSEIQIIKTRKKIKSIERRDKLIMQTISAIDDLTDLSNRLSEKLHEWYGLYYPELERKVKDNEKYSEIISKNPIRRGLYPYTRLVFFQDKKEHIEYEILLQVLPFPLS